MGLISCDGGPSSFGPQGAPLISGTGGGDYYTDSYDNPIVGADGAGSPYVVLTNERISRQSKGIKTNTGVKKGGDGGYAEGIFNVTPGATMKAVVGQRGCSTPSLISRQPSQNGYVRVIYPLAPALANSETFESNGTFTVPAGVTSITVEVWGGGGAGGPGGASQNYTGYWTYTAGGGGGSGGYAKSMFTVTPGATYSIVVGAGGSGTQTGFWVVARSNTQGVSGALSSFGSRGTYASATGGTGGVNFDGYCHGGGCNGNIYCTAGWQAPAGTSNGNVGHNTGSVGATCNVGTGGAPAGGKAFGAGGKGGASGATTIEKRGQEPLFSMACCVTKAVFACPLAHQNRGARRRGGWRGGHEGYVL